MGGGEVLRGSCIKARAFEGFVWHRVGEQQARLHKRGAVEEHDAGGEGGGGP